MSLKRIVAATAFALAVTACQALPEDMTVAQYCARPVKANMDLCKMTFEIDGERRRLADTSMSMSEARTITDKIERRANTADFTELGSD